MINHFTTKGMLCQEQIEIFLFFLAIRFNEKAIFTIFSPLYITKLDFFGVSCHVEMKDERSILSVFVIFSTKILF
jgi:hypothetical protein